MMRCGNCTWLPLFFVLLLLSAASVEATTYYVSPSGSDSNSGLAGSPWATPQHAANTVQAGDIVMIANGTYAGFRTRSGGTLSNPIVFRGDGDNVVLNASNSSTPDIINVENTDYVVIDNFIISGGGRGGVRVATCRGVVVKNNTVGPVPRWCIFTAFVPEVQVLDNVCFGAQEQHGIYISNSREADDNAIVSGNECYGNGHNGIQFNGDCSSGGDGILSGNIIENNYIHDNGWKGFSLISITNSIIRNNIVIENGIDAGAGGIHLADEPGCGNPSINNVVVNNTIYEPRIAGMRMTDGSSPNVIFNNISIASSTSRAIVDEVGGNLIDSASNLRLTSTSGLFVNAAGADYHLASGSAAIDAGVASYQGENAPAVDADGSARPQGSAFDVGAYEYNQGGGGDTTPPEVSITSPSNGAVVSGTVTVQATATDNVAVAGVTFRIDGAGFGSEDTSSPYQRDLDTAAYPNGGYTLTAVARDPSGNSTTSQPVSITIDNTPEPPSAPTGFTATGGDDGCAALAWNSSPEPDVVSYTIYYGTESVESGPATSYPDSIEVSISFTSWNVCGLPDDTYYFAIRARNAADLMSPASSEETATVTNGGSQGPLPPQQVSVAASSPGCAMVSWQASGDPTVTGFRVYYGTLSVAGGEAQEYEDSVDVDLVNSVEVCDLEEGTYYFAVRSFTDAGVFSGYSTERPLEVSGPQPAVSSTRGEITPDGYWAGAPEKPLEVRDLPLNWTVRIFDIAGNEIVTFTNRSQDGLDWVWDFANGSGQLVARGLYLIRVTDGSGDVKRTGRFLVQRNS